MGTRVGGYKVGYKGGWVQGWVGGWVQGWVRARVGARKGGYVQGEVCALAEAIGGWDVPGEGAMVELTPDELYMDADAR